MLVRLSLLVQGVGRRYANLVLKKADIDMNKRAGELSEEEVRYLLKIALVQLKQALFRGYNYMLLY